MKKELKPGDRVRVYDAFFVGGRMKSKVVCIHAKRPLVKIWGFDDKWFHFNQCRRLRPKAKPERERIERVERFLRMHVDGLEFLEKDRNEAEIIGKLTPHHCQRVVRLVELKPGEIPVSREALAAAWDLVSKRYGLNSPSNEGEFKDFLQALGFPVSTKGEGA